MTYSPEDCPADLTCPVRRKEWLGVNTQMDLNRRGRALREYLKVIDGSGAVDATRIWPGRGLRFHFGVSSVRWPAPETWEPVPGTVRSPEVARLTLTRAALMKKAERQKRERSGYGGLLAAIRGKGK